LIYLQESLVKSNKTPYIKSMENTLHILDTSPKRLKEAFEAAGLKKFRATQVREWVMDKGIIDPEQMSNLSKDDRVKVTEVADFSLPEMTEEQKANDGVVKWLFKLHDGHEVETVFIPEDERGTLCVSSQVGCTLTCRFCHTGTQALARNLTAAEILAQVYVAKRQLGEWLGNKRKVTNVVFMGMGEPLYNTDNVIKSLNVLMSENGFNISSRKLTVSTSGVVPDIARIGELGVNLAVSLHAADNETRTSIMPINKKYPVEDLIEAVRAYPLKGHRRITWEYVMLSHTNDTAEHAHALGQLIEGIPSLVNMIPFNPWPGSPFERSSNNRMHDFARVLKPYSCDVTLRKARGEDILAACGQLRSESSKGKNTVSVQYPSVIAEYGSDAQKVKVAIENEG
jgi:23S rRNA (adenine2503-C2)-methyltransferase